MTSSDKPRRGRARWDRQDGCGASTEEVTSRKLDSGYPEGEKNMVASSVIDFIYWFRKQLRSLFTERPIRTRSAALRPLLNYV